MAQASQFASNNGQVGSRTPTTGGGRNLFGTTTTPLQPVKEKGAVVQAIERAIAIQSQEEVKREFMWQKTKGEEKRQT